MKPIERFDELTKFLHAIKEPFDQIWLKWWDWHIVHPEVELNLLALAMQAKRRHFSRYGIGAIWEVMRWHMTVEVRPDGGQRSHIDEFKCSNDYRSRYARYLMWKHPELVDFFELRPLRTTRGVLSDAAEATA